MQGSVVLRAVLLNDTSVQNHYGCKLVVDNIYKAATNAGIEIVHAVPIGTSWEDETHKRMIELCDLVLVNGEGTLHSSKSGAVLLASVSSFCKRLGKKCFLFNTVYQNNSSEVDRLIKEFDGVFVRESKSADALRAVGITSVVVPDMVFYSHRELFSKSGGAREGVMFTASAIKEYARILFTASLSVRGSCFVTLSQEEAQNTRASRVGWKNRLRCILISILGFRGYALLNGFIGIGWVSFSPAKYSTSSLLDLINRVCGKRFVYTGFFHMTCFCLMTRTPFCAVPSNTHKIEGLLADIGISQRVISKERFLAGKGWALGGFSSRELKLIQDYCCLAEESIEAMFRVFAAKV